MGTQACVRTCKPGRGFQGRLLLINTAGILLILLEHGGGIDVDNFPHVIIYLIYLIYLQIRSSTVVLHAPLGEAAQDLRKSSTYPTQETCATAVEHVDSTSPTGQHESRTPRFPPDNLRATADNPKTGNTPAFKGLSIMKCGNR